MPSHTRVQQLICDVEQGRFLDALREFYHEDVAFQENSEPPREGLAANLDHEAQFLATVRTFHEICAVSFLVDGDRVAIRWIFDVTLKSGRRLYRDEIAYQRWEGEKIVCERFFYDPDRPTPSDPLFLDVLEQAQEGRGAACVIVGDQGQITLPTALLRQHTLEPGDRLRVTETPLGLMLGLNLE